MIVDTEGRTVTIAGINGEVLLMLWRLENEPEATAEEASARSIPMALLMARLAENVK
ncbi:MAG: hypothetical protein LUE97_02065 [Oscillospiraceae bacterium]|nr:hypothetical protein [Oscillospiraceae bacterium]